MKKYIFFLSIALIAGCGGNKDTNSVSKKTSSSTKIEKDSTTPAEKGGYGFEKLAESLGYETYVWSEKDGTYFGDPRSKKGGSIHYIHSLFEIYTVPLKKATFSSS